MNPPIKLLVLCTGNSCRSVLGEALFRHLGAGRVQAYSAGSRPVGRVNVHALAALARHGLPTEGYSSKSWDDLADTAMDIVITVCDSAAGEACPAYLGTAVRGHWGMPDPAHAEGTPEQIAAAFDATYAALERRVRALLALPLEAMSAADIAAALRRVHEEAGA